ncbi:MAG: hypothetical protein HOQ07_12975, partial [Sinomonas sp.]|nr:hypothetical protein [Sinomonas sp.]
QLKQAKDKESSEAKANAEAVAAIESEIAGWQALLAGADEKPAAKKAAVKK